MLVVRWTSEASPRDFGALAPRMVDFANRGDPGALALMQAGAAHIDALGARLIALGVTQLSLVGGLAIHMRRWLSDDLQATLVPPAGDALDGALRLARFDAEFDCRLTAALLRGDIPDMLDIEIGMAAELREAPDAVRRQNARPPSRSLSLPHAAGASPRRSSSPARAASPRMPRPSAST